jgi:hypothetical protein
MSEVRQPSIGDAVVFVDSMGERARDVLDVLRDLIEQAAQVGTAEAPMAWASFMVARRARAQRGER